MNIESQCKKLADHIMKGNGISSMLAFKMFGITSLHRRLTDLRNVGIPVDMGTWAEHNGKRFKIYRKNEIAEGLMKHQMLERSFKYVEK
jgi:hypothetical protein